MNSDLQGRPFFASWSGGKDSCLALYRAIGQGGGPRRLFTMFAEEGRSRSHGLPRTIIEAQAAAMGIPVRIETASWDDYESVFLDVLAELRDEGIVDGVFGDIDLAAHREWVERVCGSRGVRPHLPLWQEERRDLLDDFIGAGFRAMIVVVDHRRLDESFLGRVLDRKTVMELEAAGVDACGEEGEYHSLVFDGPLFAAPLEISRGAIVRRDGYSFLETGCHGEVKAR
ncbi:MAG: diphthine--ammonia ligase [Desulfobulbaceae bacterium]